MASTRCSPRVTLAVLWLALQVAIPESYYLYRAEHDHLDEAGAWRMFSPVHLAGCETLWYVWMRGDSTAERGTLVRVADIAGYVWEERFSTGMSLRTHDFVASFVCRATGASAVGYTRHSVPWYGTREYKDEKILAC